MTARLFVAGLTLAIALPAFAQGTPSQQPATQQTSQDPEKPPTFEEQVVVTASRSEEQLVNAPAAVTLITTETIENSPATNIGDLLRAVPGMNVTQVSARDVNITTRGATSTLATSQLALVDGRSVYLDFFGMVMWDLVPTNPHEIKQVEVVRGPASAVWGANAMTGVVNVITKSPRELARDFGNSVTIGFGGFNRDVTGREEDTGTLFYVNGSHAQAVDEKWSYKLSAGYFTQDALPRPTGNLPGGTPYPSFANTGTSQPKFDARVDYELDGGARLTVSGGVAGTEGIIHSGIGPFDVDSDSRLGYATVRYTKGGRRVAFFTNLLHGDAANLLTVGTNRLPIDLAFDTKTFDIEAGDVHAIGTRHALSYGGNFRRNTFDISIAPNSEDRNEGGAYMQDEIFLGSRFRWVVGGRLDKFSSIDNAVFSPRTTLMYKPAANQTFRASFNRAFRAPSLINNHLDVTILTPVILPVVGPFLVTTQAVGNPGLEQETLTAFELGYSGVVARRTTVSVAVYWNNTDGSIAFTPVAAYSPANPPPGWPLPPAFVPPGALPSRFTYLNLGTIKDKGAELGIDTSVNQYLNLFANYSYQWMPEIEDFPAGVTINDVNRPARNRFNAGFNFSYERFLGNLAVNYTDESYWQDVLDARFAGTTDPFTLVNAAIGARWLGEKIVTSIKLTNLANQEVQQHIFGDIMRRQVVGEVRFNF
ncbi:MAG TPA: TonB-dependent receptor [Vicinamibacterales bacterium]|nr:TonB-dependent receptor [Vicinamibacterales bacterium]